MPLPASFSYEPVRVSRAVDSPDGEPESVSAKPAQATVDDEAIQDFQPPAEGLASATASAATPSPSKPTVGSNPESDPPASGEKPNLINNVAGPASKAATPVPPNPSLVVSKWDHLSRAAIPLGYIDKWDPSPSGPAVLAVPMNCNQESRMPSAFEYVSHFQLLFLRMAGSSNATPPRASDSQPFLSPLHARNSW